MPLIVFEGADGTGKSTLIDSVAEWLRTDRCKVTVVRNPGGTALGQSLRSLVKNPKSFNENIVIDPHTEQLIMLCDISATIEQIIRQAHPNDWILMDRYNFISGMAYGTANDVPLLDIQKQHAIIHNVPQADWLFVLRCRLETTDARRGLRRVPDSFEDRGSSFLQKVHQTYSTLLESPCLYQYVKTRELTGKLCAEYVDAETSKEDMLRCVLERLTTMMRER